MRKFIVWVAVLGTIALIILGIRWWIGLNNVKSMKVGNINPSDVQYYKDDRTNPPVCFGVIGAAKGMNWNGNATSMGAFVVDCDCIPEKFLND